MCNSKKIVRKPNNLITKYWDDMEGFLADAKKVDRNYELYLSNLDKEERALPKFNTWGCRYTILSSFLYLEAFINLEYFHHLFPTPSPKELNQTQIANLDRTMIETHFDEKWSTWIENFVGKKLKLKGEREYQELMQLKNWRNHLTHYKIQHMMFIHKEIETVEGAIEAKRIAVQSTKWYYDITQVEIPEWIQRDVLASSNE